MHSIAWQKPVLGQFKLLQGSCAVGGTTAARTAGPAAANCRQYAPTPASALNPLLQNSDRNGKVIRKPYPGPDHHRTLITSRRSPMFGRRPFPRSWVILLTDRRTDRQTARQNERSHYSASLGPVTNVTITKTSGALSHTTMQGAATRQIMQRDPNTVADLWRQFHIVFVNFFFSETLTR